MAARSVEETHKYWIDTIISEGEDDLTDWERSFISSIQDRMADGRPLTDKQAETLERIYDKITP